MKPIRLVAFAAIFTGVAVAGVNTQEVCDRITAAAGGGKGVEDACWESEEAAIDELAEIFASLPAPVPPEWPYCMRVAEAAGGSQQVRLTCWKKAMGEEP